MRKGTERNGKMLDQLRQSNTPKPPSFDRKRSLFSRRVRPDTSTSSMESATKTGTARKGRSDGPVPYVRHERDQTPGERVPLSSQLLVGSYWERSFCNIEVPRQTAMYTAD